MNSTPQTTQESERELIEAKIKNKIALLELQVSEFAELKKNIGVELAAAEKVYQQLKHKFNVAHLDYSQSLRDIQSLRNALEVWTRTAVKT